MATLTGIELRRVSLQERLLADVMSGLQHAGSTGILDLEFDDLGLKTQLAFRKGRLGGIRSPFVPSWSETVIPPRRRSVEVERDGLEARRPVEFLGRLVSAGVIEPERVKDCFTKGWWPDCCRCSIALKERPAFSPPTPARASFLPVSGSPRLRPRS